MRWKALAEIYTMHSFAQLCNLNVFVKKLPHIFSECSENRQFFRDFGKKMSIENGAKECLV